MNNKQEENNRQKEIGNRIKVLIKEKGFTQSEFAETMNVERETLSGWLNGRRMPSLDVLAVLCDNLNVDMDFITGRISCKTHTAQDIQNATGLSEKAIEKLLIMHGNEKEADSAKLTQRIYNKALLQKAHDKHFTESLSALIESGDFIDALECIYTAKDALRKPAFDDNSFDDNSFYGESAEFREKIEQLGLRPRLPDFEATTYRQEFGRRMENAFEKIVKN